MAQRVKHTIYPAREIAQQALDPGEELIWADAPGPWSLARQAGLELFNGLFFFGFAIFWTLNAAQAPGPFPFVLFGVPFVAIGASMLLKPLWLAFGARYMIYAVTDRRLLILKTWPLRRQRSFLPRDIRDLELSEQDDGSGDIVFGSEAVRSGNRLRQRKIGFFGIADAHRVEAEIRKLKG